MYLKLLQVLGSDALRTMNRPLMPQVSKPAASPLSKSAGAANGPQVWKLVTRQTWMSALRRFRIGHDDAPKDLNLAPRKKVTCALVSRSLIFVMLACQWTIASAAQAVLSQPVKSWLAAQTNVQTWSADLTQTRTLKSLTGALTAKGKVWFAEPDQFRWELGQPPETIAIRAHTKLLILYPKLKRVERISLAGQQTGPWRSALDMLEAGFPQSEAELRTRYRVLSQSVTHQTCKLILQPRSSAIQKMVSQIEIDFNTNNDLLQGTELKFSDGSTMRNDFHDVVLNPKLDQDVFAPTIPKGYTVVEPLKKR